MWKPGSKKPAGSQKKKGKSPRSSTSATISGLQIPSSLPKKNDQQSPNDDDPGRSPDPLVKSLSGSTMNMRFMQRHQQQSRSVAPPGSQEKQTTTTVASKTTSLEKTSPLARDQSTRSSPVRPMSMSPQRERNIHQTMEADYSGHDSVEDDDDDDSVEMNDATSASIRYGVASAADMYGDDQVAVIGRRSFGGFNPNTAEAWTLSQQSERGGDMQKQISDQELLKRYQESRKCVDRQKPKNPRHGAPNDRNGSKKLKTRLS